MRGRGVFHLNTHKVIVSDDITIYLKVNDASRQWISSGIIRVRPPVSIKRCQGVIFGNGNYYLMFGTHRRAKFD